MIRWIAVSIVGLVAVAAIASVALWPDPSAAQGGTPTVTPNPNASPTPAETPLEALTQRVNALDDRVDALSQLHVQPDVITWNCTTLTALQTRSFDKKMSDFEIQAHVENLNLMLGSSPLSETGVQAVATECELTLR